MIAKFITDIEAGDFIRVLGHRVQPRLRQMWWKVTEVRTDGMLLLINRHGQRDCWYCHNGQIAVWEPGDDRNDSI